MDLALAHTPGEVPDGEHVVPLGKAAVAAAQARDVTLVSYAKTVGHCLQAADSWRQHGIDAEVIDLRTLKPLDEATILRSVRKTGRADRRARGQPPVRRRRRGRGDCQREGLRRAEGAGRASPGRTRPAAASWVLEQAAVPQAEAIAARAMQLVDVAPVAA